MTKKNKIFSFLKNLNICQNEYVTESVRTLMKRVLRPPRSAVRYAEKACAKRGPCATNTALSGSLSYIH
jgi:DNA-binding MltR family transcriptional regulator